MLKKLTLKLHLYLGLAASLILVIVGVTGAMLSYEKELLRLFNPHSYYVKPQERVLPFDEMIEKFQSQKPDAKLIGFSFAGEIDSAYIFRIASKTNRRGDSVFVNPYTAEILPEASGAEFFRFTEDLHRRLAYGEVGKQIVGAATIILIVLLLSGIYIYMPKIKRGFISSLKINKKAKGVGFISSLHSVVGMWVIPLYLILSLSGLYWSYTWYNNALFKITGVEKPQRFPPAKGQKRLAINPVEVKEVFDTFYKEVDEYQSIFMFIPQAGDEYRFFYVDKNPAHIYARNTLVIDSSVMDITKHERYNDKTINGKFMSSMRAIHTGEFFGGIGQFLMFISSLAMPIFAITGLMLYLRKKKKK